MQLILTKHAIQRARERFDWSPNVLRVRAEKSLTEGIDLLGEESLRPLWIRSCQLNDGIPYAYEGVVFVFNDNIVITVYSINNQGRVW